MMRTAQLIDRYIPDNTVIVGELNLAKILAEVGTRTHYVYFLLAELDDGQTIVKIGTSAVIERRILLIKNRVSYKIIELLGQIEGDQELESTLHLAFHKFKHAKEWFYFEPIEFHIAEFLQNHGVDPEACFHKRNQVFSKVAAKMQDNQCKN